MALFFAFQIKKYSHERERTTRERTTNTRTTENEEDDDNHDDATTTRNDAKTNDGRGEYHPLGRGRFGTTGDE